MSSRTRILFVDDEPYVLSALERMLFDREDEWDMHFVDSGQLALEAFEQQPFRVVVTDMRMPEMDGAQLLIKIQQRWPLSVRIILSGQAEKESILRSIGPSHRFLPKPCDSNLLYESIHRALSLHERLGTAHVRDLVAEQTNLPTMPRLYHLLLNEMQQQAPSIQRVSELIAQDDGIGSKLLQIVNSALNGKSIRLTNAGEVVRTIGIDRLRPLIIAAGIFSHFEALPFSVNQNADFIDHSSTVSRLAQAIVERELPGNTVAAGAALLGGLIHDIGKLALASGKPNQYLSLIDGVEHDETSICERERGEFGCDHAAVGAYLLALWGIPDDIAETVAYHEQPALSDDRRFSPITAVHVANAIDNAQRSGDEPQFDLDYLKRIGVANKLPRWRELLPTIQHSWFYPAMVEGVRAGTETTLSI